MHRRFQLLGGEIELIDIETLQGQLVETADPAAADIDRRPVDRHGPDPGHRVELGPQFLNHLVDIFLPFGPGFEDDQHKDGGVDTDQKAIDIGVFLEDFRKFHRVIDQGRPGDVLGGLGGD